jgi:hypothetical protein
MFKDNYDDDLEIRFSVMVFIGWSILKLNWEGMFIGWSILKLNWEGMFIGWSILKLNWEGMFIGWSSTDFDPVV